MPDLKTLTAHAVRDAAESLLLTRPYTSAEEVCTLLGERGYGATEAVVINWLDSIALTEQWDTFSNENGRWYRYGPQPELCFSTYLVRGREFWSVSVEGALLRQAFGYRTENGSEQLDTMDNNQQAVSQANAWIHEQLEEGFKVAADPRLPLAVRERYRDWLTHRPERVTLQFTRGEEVTEQGFMYQADGGWQAGRLRREARAGYTLSFDPHPTSLSLLDLLLELGPFNALQLQDITLERTSLCVRGCTALTTDGAPLPMAYCDKWRGEGILTALTLDPAKLYRVTLRNGSGETLTLDAFDEQFTDCFLPLVRELLSGVVG